jgi:nicotinamidase-related amidase
MFERRPADTAPIIVIDLQTGMFDGAVEPPIHDSSGLVARVQAVMDWARRTRRKIAFVRHDGEEGDSLAPGSPGWPVWPALGLVGAQTDQCVAATVTGAIEAGFRVTVVSDAHSTVDFGGETAEELIARYNAAFTTAGVNLVTTQSLAGI